MADCKDLNKLIEEIKTTKDIFVKYTAIEAPGEMNDPLKAAAEEGLLDTMQ